MTIWPQKLIKRKISYSADRPASRQHSFDGHSGIPSLMRLH